MRGQVGRRALLLGAIILVQCATGVWAQSDLDDLVKAAKAEGEVILYTSAVENVAKKVSNSFQEKYGIKVSFVRLASSSLMQRYAAEAEAGNVVADIAFIAGGSKVLTVPAAAKGWIEPVAAAKLPVVTSGEFPTDWMLANTALLQSVPMGIVYNTDKISKSDLPKTFEDILNPKYKAQILLADPRSSDVYIAFFARILELYGEGFFDKLRALEPRHYAGGVPAVQALGAGEGTFMFPMYGPAVNGVKDKGAPIDIVFPEGTTGVIMEVMLTARDKAKHPAAARLLANYVMSKEGNGVFNSQPGEAPIYDQSSLPKGYVQPSQDLGQYRERIIKLLGYQ